MDRGTEGIRTYFCFLIQLSLIMKTCDTRCRNGGWNAVEVGVETVSPGREIDLCFLAGDLDQAVGLIICEGFVQPYGQTKNRPADRRSLRQIPSTIN